MTAKQGLGEPAAFICEAAQIPYWMVLATDENTLLALDPISLIVPTTTARITASMTAYSAMSCPSSPLNRLLNFVNTAIIFDPRQTEEAKGGGIDFPSSIVLRRLTENNHTSGTFL
jgi:hypothetical protein